MDAFRNAVVFAASGAHNVGDELIVRSEVGYLRQRYPAIRIRVATYDALSTLVPATDLWVSPLPYFPNALSTRPFRNLWYLFETVMAVWRSDLVVIGGGGIFYDNEHGQSFFRQCLGWRLRVALARFFRKKLLFWGVGVDLKDENAKKIAGIFRNATVTVRDPASAATLGRFGVDATVVPDPAFLEEPRPDMAGSSSRRLAGVSLRDLYLPRGEEDARSIVRILREEGFEPVFVNHSIHPSAKETNDRAFVENVARAENVESTDSVRSAYEKYPKLSLMVAMRLHAGLLAAVSGIPTVLLSYSKKTDEFTKRVGVSSVLRAADFTEADFKNALRSAVSESEGGRNFALLEKCGKIREESRISYDEIFHGLERS